MTFECKFAYSTNAYTHHSLHYAVNEIKNLGFSGIEILADVPHISPRFITRNEILNLKSLLNRSHLVISNLNSNTAFCHAKNPQDKFGPTLISDSRIDRELRLSNILKSIEIAETIGADNVSISTGEKGSASKTNAMRRFIKSLNSILKYAERKKIKIGIEYEPGHLIDRCDVLMDLFQIVQNDFLGANLDIGHSFCQNEDTTQVIKTICKKIWNAHLEDIKDKIHDHLIIGKGDIDWKNILNAFKAINYNRFLTFELYPYVSEPSYAGKESLKNIRKHFRDL